MDKAYDDFLAAYQAWECASESCHARLLQSADADSTVSGVAADFDQLQRLYVDWLDKLGTAAVGPGAGTTAHTAPLTAGHRNASPRRPTPPHHAIAP